MSKPLISLFDLIKAKETCKTRMKKSADTGYF